MSLRKCIRSILFASSFCIAGCDPYTNLEWQTEFDGKLDESCIEVALKSVAPDVNRIRSTSKNFPPGAQVTYYVYSEDHHEIQLVALPDGMTRYSNKWGKVAADAGEIARASALLESANSVVANRCGLPLAGVQLQVRD